MGRTSHMNPKSWNNIKLNYTSYGCMQMEIDCGDKSNYTSYGCRMANWNGHETQPTGHNTSEVDWGCHDPNPNHMNESLLSEVDWGAHDPSVFQFLANIDYDAKPNPEKLTGGSIQSFLTLVVQLQWLVALGRLVTHAQITTLSFLKLTLKKLMTYGGIILISRPIFMDIYIFSK